MRDVEVEAAFGAFVADVEPRLRRTLISAYGPVVGREATADALAWAWEHFGRVRAMDNPGGYLYRVGQSSARRSRRAGPPLADASAVAVDPTPEPGLDDALAQLSLRQRTAVLLVHGFGYTLEDAADAMGCRVSTLRNHLDRGLSRLRARMGVTDDA